MRTAAHNSSRTRRVVQIKPSFIFHPSFEEAFAEEEYGAQPGSNDDHLTPFMPDEVTRNCAKNMHYAAWRANGAADSREARCWWGRYFDYRDRIVLGNRKLTYRAVSKWSPPPQFADDLTSECQIVLIKVVSAFNPWLGIRFSTYACTCLMRAISRLSHRLADDRLYRSLPLDSLPYGELCSAAKQEPADPNAARVYKYLQKENDLLTHREKVVLARRFRLNDQGQKIGTLEQVGRDLGLSKERIRQVQKSALEKLRGALL